MRNMYRCIIGSDVAYSWNPLSFWTYLLFLYITMSSQNIFIPQMAYYYESIKLLELILHFSQKQKTITKTLTNIA